MNGTGVYDILNPALDGLAMGIAEGNRRFNQRMEQTIAFNNVQQAVDHANAWQDYAERLEAQNKALARRNTALKNENESLKNGLEGSAEYIKELTDKLRAVKRAHYANSSEKEAMKASLEWIEGQLADLSDPEKAKSIDISRRHEVFRQAWEEFRASTTVADLANIAYKIENVKNPRGRPAFDDQ